MNPVPCFEERLRAAFQLNARGIVGVVDELLTLCRETVAEAGSHPSRSHARLLELGWNDGTCSVRLHITTSREVGLETCNESGAATAEMAQIQTPLSKPVFRAMLARFAALCNEHITNSVSPYGGEGVIPFGPDPRASFRVEFKNTPREQWLEVRHVGELPSPKSADSTRTLGAPNTALTSPDAA